MSAQGTVTLRDVTEADLPVFFEFERIQRERDGGVPGAGPRSVHAALDGEHLGQRHRAQTDGTARRRGRGEHAELGAVGRYARRILDRARLWGRGVATRALTLFLTEVDTRPLHAHVVNRNIGSVRVLEKCEFRIVGEETVEEPGVRIVEVILRLEADPTRVVT